MLKVFARFSSPEEHDQLVQGFIKEKQVRAKLEELRDLKKKGFKTVVDLSQNIWIKRKKDDKSKKETFAPVNKHFLNLNHKRSKKDFILDTKKTRP